MTLGGYKLLELEANSEVAISLMNEKISDSHPLRQLVFDMRNLFRRNSRMKLMHTFNEGNCAIDYCASLDHSLCEGFQVFLSPPSDLL